jgi:cytochrome c-type biogenesis protein CcmH/NrfG
MEGIMTPQSRPSDSLAERLHSIAQYLIVGVFGLLPIVFLPGVEFSLAFTKTSVAATAVLLALALYGFAVLRTGRFKISLPLPAIVLWLIVIAASASAFLSGDVRDAFFGDYLEQQTVVFLGLLALIVTVVPHILTDKRRIYTLYIGLAISTIVLAVFHLVRLFLGPNTLTFGVFGGNQVFTPVGSWNDLAIFFGLTILLSIVALEQLSLQKQGRWLFAGVTAIALLMLAVINFSPVWFVLFLVSLLVLVFSVARDRLATGWLQGAVHSQNSQKKFSALSLIIAGVVFLTSFVFIAGGSVIGGRVSQATNISYVEVRPSLQATTDIIRDTYKTDALFGIGPNKFIDAWRLHRDPSLNSTIFWNTDFLAGVGYIPTFFVTLGIVGGVLWFVFLGLFLITGIRTLLNAVSPDRMWFFIGTASFVAGLYLWILSIVYVPGQMLIILAALCTGLLLAARNALEPHREREISLEGNQRSGFILVSVAMLAVIFAMSALYVIGRQYAGAYVFAQGERTLQGGDVATARTRVAEAYVLATDDRFVRRSAEIDYADLITVLNLPANTPDLETRFRDSLRNSVANAGRAVALDGTDANNWSILGATYSSVVPLKIDGAYDRAKEALEKSRSLDPQNPIRLLMLARLEFANGNAERTRELINDAIRLKPDYIDAAFMLSQLEIAAGNVDAAIQSTLRTIDLEPQNPARFFQLGILALAKNDIQTGVAALEAAVLLDPQYANARYYLAFAYDRLGRPGDAKAQLEKVLETNPGNQDVASLLERLKKGEKISAITAPQQTAPDQTRTTTEGRESVTQNPDSPLLTPVNPVPKASEKKATTTGEQ